MSGGAVTISNVITSGTTTTFTTSRAIASTETGNFLGAAGAFTDSASPANAAAAFSIPVTASMFGGPAAPPPASVKATVPHSGDFIYWDFTGSAHGLLPASGVSGLAITVNGSPVPLAAGGIYGPTVQTPVLGPQICPGDVVYASYAPGNLTTSDSPPVGIPAFSGLPVTNNSTVAPGFALYLGTPLLVRGGAGGGLDVNLTPGAVPSPTELTLTAPAGITGTFSENPVTPPASVTVSLSASPAATLGEGMVYVSVLNGDGYTAVQRYPVLVTD